MLRIGRIFTCLFMLTLVTPLTATADETWFPPVVRDWSLRLIGGSYKPVLDSQFDGSGSTQTLPYQNYFGANNPLMLTFGIERFITNVGGGISLGATAGIWSVEGALKSNTSSETTSDKTELALYPLSLEVSYYLDSFSAYFPLIPYGRVGADYCIWEIEDGAGETASFVYQTADGQAEYEAFGATKGWHYAIGVQLLLDTLDPKTAASFEQDAGVRNTYLGLEFRNTQIDDFGSAQSLRLGGKSLNFGLFIDI